MIEMAVRAASLVLDRSAPPSRRLVYSNPYQPIERTDFTHTQPWPAAIDPRRCHIHKPFSLCDLLGVSGLQVLCEPPDLLVSSRRRMYSDGSSWKGMVQVPAGLVALQVPQRCKGHPGVSVLG